MEAILFILLTVGVVLWIRSLSYKVDVPQRRVSTRAARPNQDVVRPVVLQPPLLDPRDRGDGAFFDGYIWRRLEERHEQRQEDADGQPQDHDHDMTGEDDWDED